MPTSKKKSLDKKDKAFEKLVRQTARARQDIKEGRLYTLEEMMKMVGLN